MVGECIYSKQWHEYKPETRRSSTSLPVNEFARTKPTAVIKNPEDEAKLVFGVVFSLRNMVRKLTDEDSFVSFRTSKYRLHYYEAASNIKFVLLTDEKLDNMRTVLNEIYTTLYVEFVVKK